MCAESVLPEGQGWQHGPSSKDVAAWHQFKA
ncbi:hypothetical protein SCOCK_160076 [Actinacidiphila cocklensis]|uniref:Uncharacterized protein n=1 Tax=Actinacidiphila cocklensis TaxID=887465 RepID=A0A9W4GQ48_9ACTN|nr:hypothetical protein SCOCK_160076 [Actinacidiphila cocklensis]